MRRYAGGTGRASQGEWDILLYFYDFGVSGRGGKASAESRKRRILLSRYGSEAGRAELMNF